MADKASINGKIYAASQVRVKVQGDTYYGVTTIDYGPYKRDVVHNWNFHENPYGFSFGPIQPQEATLTMYRASATELIKKISGLGEKFETLINIDVMYKKTPKQDAQHDLLENCVLTQINATITAAEAGGLVVPFIFLPLRIKYNDINFEQDPA